MSVNAATLSLEIHVDDQGSVKIRQVGTEAEAAGRRGGRAFTSLGRSLGDVNAHAAKSVSHFRGLRDQLMSLRGALAGLGLGLGLRELASGFSVYESRLTDMGRVTSQNLDDVARRIRALRPELGSATELLEGYYQTMSAGITDPTRALETLTGASRAARAAHVEQAQTITAVTKLMAGYAGQVRSTTEATDLLFAIERAGQTTFRELVPIIGDVATLSREAGVGVSEMGAALAQMTQTAGSTSQAATQYQAVLLGLYKPQEQMRKTLAALGVSSGVALVRQLGLAGAIRAVREQAEASGLGLGRLFESQEALVGIAALGAEQWSGYEKKLAAMEQRAGATARAWEAFEQTSGAVWDAFTAAGRNASVDFAEGSAEAVKTALREMTAYLVENREGIREWGRAVGEAGVQALDTLHGTVEVYRALPDSITGPAGAGLVGRMLFGSWKAATFVALFTAINNGMAVFNQDAGRMWRDGSDALENFKKGLQVLPGILSGERDWWTGRLKPEQERAERYRSPFERWVFGQDTPAGMLDMVHTQDVRFKGANWHRPQNLATQAAPMADADPGGPMVDPEADKRRDAALKQLHERFAQLTMTAREFRVYQIERQFEEWGAVLGVTNPELQKTLELQRAVLAATTTTPEQDRLLAVAEQRRVAFDMLKNVDLDEIRLAQAQSTAEQQQRDLALVTEFSERYRALKLGDAEMAIFQVNKAAEAYRAAGADEVAVAQWAAQERLKASRDWEAGAIRALEDYAADATNAAGNTQRLFVNMFESGEDAVVRFARTGKLEISDLVDSILDDLVRLGVRQGITGPLAAALGEGFASAQTGGGSSGGSLFSWIASLFHEGGVVGGDGTALRAPASLWADAPRYHDGGRLGRDEVPIIAQLGEEVLTKQKRRTVGQALAGAADPRPLNVTIVEAPGTRATVEQDADGGLRVLIEQVEGALTRRMERGQGLARSLDGRYGRRW